MIKYPNFNPIAFRIGPLKVHWYGIMYLLGFTGAWGLARYRASRPGSTWKAVDVDDLIFYCMLGVILGGRIGYVLFYGMTFWTAHNPWYPIEVWDGGMSFHGGLLGVILAMTIFAVRRKRNAADVFDFTVPLPALGLFFGRIGNFINGELWGKPTTLPWGFLYHGVVRQPSQLYEAFFEGVVLFSTMWLFTAKPKPRLAASGLFLLLYGTFRFLVEFVRLPDPQLGYLAWGWVTMGQVLSFPMIVVGAGLLIYAYQARKTSGNYLPAAAR